jgi:hypothetical protein
VSAQVAAASDRRLIWIVRLVLYPAAVALIALWWHGHRAPAASADVDEGTALSGRTSQGEPMTAWIRDGAPRRFRVLVHYTCPADRPELANYSLPEEHLLGGDDQIEPHAMVTDVRGWRYRHRNGWDGVLALHTSARWSPASWEGTLDATVTLRYPGAPVAVCESGPVKFTLRARRAGGR